MEAENGRARTTLIERLEGESHRFEFVQAAVLLERIFATDPNRRAFRFASRARLVFDTAECKVLKLPGPHGERGTLRVNGFGVLGLLGPLPAYYSELAERRRELHDSTLTAFLAIFEDRMTRLLVEAHQRNRFWLGYTARGRIGDGGQHPFEQMLLSIAGTLSGGARRRCGIGAEAQAFYSGLLAQQPRSATALAAVVADVFRVPAALDPFVGGWVDIPEGPHNRIGGACLAASDPARARGPEQVMGDRYFDPALGFRIVLGPMPLERARGFLPDGPGADALRRFVRFGTGFDKVFEYTVVVDAAEVPEARLTSSGDAPQRLGWSFWLRAHDEPRSAVSGPFRPTAIESDTR